LETAHKEKLITDYYGFVLHNTFMETNVTMLSHKDKVDYMSKVAIYLTKLLQIDSDPKFTRILKSSDIGI
jgi:hypothetical protein